MADSDVKITITVSGAEEAKKQLDEIKQYAEGVTAKVQTGTAASGAVVDDQIQKSGQTLAESLANLDKFNAAAMARAKEAAKNTTDTTKETQDALAKMAKDGADSINKSIFAWAEGAKDPLKSFKDFAIKQFEEIAAAAIIRPIFQPAIASALGSAADFFSLVPTKDGFSGSSSSFSLTGSTSALTGVGSSVSNYINTFGTNYLGTGVGPNSVLPADLATANLTGPTLTQILGGAGAGAFAGNFLTGIIGGNQTIGTIGGGVSGALAMINPYLGAAAAAVTLLGSLFGPKMSNNTGVSNLDLATGVMSSGAGDPRKVDQANINAAGQLTTSVEQFVKFLSSEAGVSAQGRTFFEVGSRDGIRANVAGVDAHFSNDAAGAAQAVGFAVKQVAAQLGDKLPKEIATALDHVDFSSTASIAAALSQLELVKKFMDTEQKYAQAGTPVDQFEASYAATLEQLKSLGEQVRALGISAEETDDLIDKYSESVRANFKTTLTATYYSASGQGFLNNIQGAITTHTSNVHDAGVIGAETDLADDIYKAQLKGILGGLNADQLATVGKIFADVPEIVDAVAVASTALTNAATAQHTAAEEAQASAEAQATAAAAAAEAQRAHADAFARINELYNERIQSVGDQISQMQASAQTWSNIADTLRDFGSGLLTDSSFSPLGLGDQVSTARAQMEDVFNKALGGDSDAAAQFPDLAKHFLTLDKQFNASNTAYAADFDLIESMSTRLQTAAGSQVSLAQQQLGKLQQILDALTAQQRAMNGNPAGYSRSYAEAITSAYGTARQASGMSDLDFINSGGGKVWIDVRNDLIAGTRDPDMLREDLVNARAQAAQSGWEAIGAGYVAAVIAQMQKLNLPIPQFADGGIATRPTLAWVAEAGNAEAMIPLRNGSVPVSLGGIGPRLDRLAAAVDNLAGVSHAGHTRTIAELRSIVENTRDAADAPIRAQTLAATAGRRRVLSSVPM
jgi:hypothetical protein